ncbi:unnamed protein product [Closterium sp. Yama58-4]|nr:unnamed protein product [Closterium sp. Yama58-4]
MTEALVQRLQHYSTLHAACTASITNWPAFFNDSSKGLQENSTAAHMASCKYLLWVEPNYSGLGNQLLSLVSSFAYALLTNRTLLINPECFPARLLCNPFPYSSWAPPALDRGSFNHMRLRAEKRRVGYNAFQEPGAAAANTTDDDAADAVFSNLNYSAGKNRSRPFPSSAHRGAELERLFPDRLPLMHVGRYLLHPANYLWEEITRAFRAYLAPYQYRVGIQIRDFTTASSNEGEALARVLHCAVNISHGLPPALPHDQWRHLASNQSAVNSSDVESIQKAAGAGTVHSVGVLVASLKRSYVDALHEAYVEGLPLDGYNVAVTSLSHEGEQKTGDLLQLERALKEMWLLSMCDLLLVSDSSTFGYMAAGLAGVSPFSLNIVPRMKSDWLHNGRPACVVTTPEACYLTMLDNKQQHVQCPGSVARSPLNISSKIRLCHNFKAGIAAPPPPAPALPAAPGLASSICPLTGLPPKNPTVPVARCPAAKDQSCCDNCTDMSTALHLVASNLKDVVTQINPTIADGIDSSIAVCDIFTGMTPCLQLLEDLMCGLSCNPNAGYYATKSNTGVIMNVCSDLADKVFTQCKGLQFGDMSLSGLVTTTDEFMSLVVTNVIKTLGVEGFEIQISSSPCFNGTGSYPLYTACCDPLNLLLLVVATLSVAHVHGLSLASPSPKYPACPFTGKQPTKPAVPPPRCKAAVDASCCADCTDLNTALGIVGTNLTSVVAQISPQFVDLIDPKLKVCDLFTGQAQCAQLIEDLLCGLSCNPNSGSYVTVVPNNSTTMTVCTGYADTLFKACSDLSLGDGMDLTGLISSYPDFMNIIVANVVKSLGIANFKFAFTTTRCFTSSGVYPTNIACCDPLSVPATCPAGSVNTTEYADLIGRTIDPANCLASTPSAPPSASAPGSAPLPSPAPTASPSTSPPVVTTPSPSPPTVITPARSTRSAPSPLLVVVLLVAATLHPSSALAAPSANPPPPLLIMPAAPSPSAPLISPAASPPASSPPSPPKSAYPTCPLTGKPPQKPKVPPTRCPGAAELSCCESCTDLNSSLMLAGSTLGDLVGTIDPALVDFINGSMKLCELFEGQVKCGQLLEDLVCAAQCNPDAGNYIKPAAPASGAAANATGPTMTVCPAYAQEVYNTCQGLALSDGITLGTFIPDAPNFITMVVGGVVQVLGVKGFNATIGAKNCFAGTTQFPPYIACCDPLAVPPLCPASAINTTRYASIINRPINSSACQAGLPPPPGPASGPALSPAAAPAPAPAPPPQFSPEPSPAPAPAPAVDVPPSPPPSPSPASPPLPAGPPSPVSSTPPPSPPPSLSPSPPTPSSPASTTPSPPPPPPKPASPPPSTYISLLSFLLSAGVALLALALLL